MKVLSIKEPFASLVCLGKKKIETRSWKTNYRGRIYVHASLKKVVVKDDRYRKLIKLLPENYNFKYGKIICKANLVDCIYMDDEFLKKIKTNETEFLCGHYEVGRYAWILDDVEVSNKPISAKGRLGIWNYNILEK